MSELPTRPIAKSWADRHKPSPVVSIVAAYADDTLQTAEEWRDRPDVTTMFMCWSIPEKRWMMRGHSAMAGCNSRCGQVSIGPLSVPDHE